jgi:CheY-like chemotaxis protein
MKNPKYCFLIDDDQDEQEIFLEAANEVNPNLVCKVDCDAENALLTLKQSAQLPDIIFLDINMPKMNGFEFLVHLKRDDRLKYIPVIFYSTTKDENQIERATTLGANGFITKNNSYDELCRVLKIFLTDSPVREKHFIL